MPYISSAVRSKQAIAAARSVLVRDGVAGTTMRAVAAEAQIPLGTLQYVYPSKQLLLRAVIEDVVEEIADVLRRSANLDEGLGVAIKDGVRRFWTTLVEEHRQLQLVQLELVTHALRTPGLDTLAGWQYEQYTRVVTEWCEAAATRAHESSAISYEQLARLIIAGLDGLIIQHVVNPDLDRSGTDLDQLIAMLVDHAAVQPDPSV
ncbi:TetR/AcrR family transcriptional regulator [Mycolicibacterium sp. 050232]|uniref:TetR/AcrR family transcriptional regulator n=1 Tax=Mycolicibacterium sp. 050232 TaxID=3113982 RepID=UPI002E294921|nr:TetR/AcrR family transcriptional regulator [Mycolicibacterium sp. 050232]MED5816402.1 TetR/AcrR family transcriptional regulator [Mycolicibacterium sp. 050232]